MDLFKRSMLQKYCRHNMTCKINVKSPGAPRRPEATLESHAVKHLQLQSTCKYIYPIFKFFGPTWRSFGSALTIRDASRPLQERTVTRGLDARG